MALSDAAVQHLAVAMVSPTFAQEVSAFLPSTAANNTWSGTNTFSGTVTVSGTFAHTGTTFGALGATAATQASAYTKTYSTADRTVANATVAAVATTGSTQTSPFGYAGATQADAIPVAINALAADVLQLKKVVVSLVTDLQRFGFAG